MGSDMFRACHRQEGGFTNPTSLVLFLLFHKVLCAHAAVALGLASH